MHARNVITAGNGLGYSCDHTGRCQRWHPCDYITIVDDIMPPRFNRRFKRIKEPDDYKDTWECKDQMPAHKVALALYNECRSRPAGTPHPFRTTRFVIDYRYNYHEAFCCNGMFFDVEYPYVQLVGGVLVPYEKEDEVLALGLFEKEPQGIGEYVDIEPEGDGSEGGVGPMPHRRGKGRVRSRAQGVPMQVKRIQTTNPRNAIPDEFNTVLTFVDGIRIGTTGAGSAVYRFQTNGCYDVDPIFGTTSTPGFSELAALYYYYRPYAYQIFLTMSNGEVFPLSYFLVHTNADPGTTYGPSYSLGSGNAFGSSGVLGSVGSAPAHYRSRKIRVAELVGGVDVETGDNWKGGSSANPTDLVFFGLAVVSETVANVFTATGGVTFSIRVKMWVRFYDRKNLTS